MTDIYETQQDMAKSASENFINDLKTKSEAAGFDTTQIITLKTMAVSNIVFTTIATVGSVGGDALKHTVAAMIKDAIDEGLKHDG